MSYQAMMLPMVALLVARRQGGTQDAGRAALLAAAIKPPIAGLIVAIATSSQNTQPALPPPPAAPVPIPAPAGGGAPAPGGVQAELDKINARLVRIEGAIDGIGQELQRRGRGQAVLAQSIAQTSPRLSLFPSFIGLTGEQALQVAGEYGIEKVVGVDIGAPGGRVVGQDPAAGTRWKKDMKSVTLEIN